jgi:hypothetical protein
MDERGMLGNYTQLPEIVWDDIARHFEVTFLLDEIGRMENVALYSAKRPEQRFEADGESKRLEISDPVRRATDKWRSPKYEELERLRIVVSVP